MPTFTLHIRLRRQKHFLQNGQPVQFCINGNYSGGTTVNCYIENRFNHQNMIMSIIGNVDQDSWMGFLDAVSQHRGHPFAHWSRGGARTGAHSQVIGGNNVYPVITDSRIVGMWGHPAANGGWDTFCECEVDYH